MAKQLIKPDDAEIVLDYIGKSLRWLRRYESDRPGVIDLIDDIQAAVDGVEINVAEEPTQAEATHS